jgi:hypothetical protein
MAEAKEEKKLGKLCYVSVRAVANGYSISCNYEHPQSLAERNGWVPSCSQESKDYVEKTKAAVIERLKKLL